MIEVANSLAEMVDMVENARAIPRAAILTLLEDPPAWLQAMTVESLLRSIPDVDGPTRRKILVMVSGRIGDLSDARLELLRASLEA